MTTGKRNINWLPDHILKDRIPFVPEIEPTLLTYNEKLWKKIYPYKKNIKLHDYKLSNIGKYSIIYPNDANHIAKIIRSYIPKKNATITDATANMGGMTMAFSDFFDKVNAVEIVPFHCKILENNIKVYGAQDKVKIWCDDYIDIADTIEQDVVFFDPPFGGPDYKNAIIMDLFLDNISIADIAKYLLDRKLIVAVRVPFNYDIKHLVKLTEKSDIYVFNKPSGELNYFLIILNQS
jgi:16S rRNA G966 N2-methylase RsmD